MNINTRLEEFGDPFDPSSDEYYLPSDASSSGEEIKHSTNKKVTKKISLQMTTLLFSINNLMISTKLPKKLQTRKGVVKKWKEKGPEKENVIVVLGQKRSKKKMNSRE